GTVEPADELERVQHRIEAEQPVGLVDDVDEVGGGAAAAVSALALLALALVAGQQLAADGAVAVALVHRIAHADLAVGPALDAADRVDARAGGGAGGLVAVGAPITGEHAPVVVALDGPARGALERSGAAAAAFPGRRIRPRVSVSPRGAGDKEQRGPGQV